MDMRVRAVFARRSTLKRSAAGDRHREMAYQMPPAAPERSKTVTSRPSFLRCAAVTTPEMPAPITATLLLLDDMIQSCDDK